METLAEPEDVDGGRDTVYLIDPATSADHPTDGLVQELQLIQPYSDEPSCCPRKPFLYLVMSSCMAALGGVIFGYDMGIVSGAILQLRAEFQLDCIQQEMVVSSMLIGAVLASLTGGFIVDFIGRRLSIIVNSGVFLTGAILLGLAPSFPVLVIGRFVVGFGVSFSAIAECIYISEIAPAKSRGLLVSVNEVGICVGLLLAYLANVLFIELSAGWRYMFALSGIPAFIQGIGMFFLPFSPRWLIVNGYDDKACKMIQKLQWSGDPYDEMMRIKSGLKLEYRYKFTDLLSRVDNMRGRMLVGGGLVFFQQVSGQSTVVYYASTIFQALGFHSGEKATLASLGIGAAKLFATIICLTTVDKGGRRRFLLIGALLMTISIFTLGIVAHFTSLAHPARECSFNSTVQVHSTPTVSSFSSSAHATLPITSTILSTTRSDLNDSSIESFSDKKRVGTGLRYVTLGTLVLFVGAYSFSFGPVSWLLLSEIYPAGIKGRAFSIVTILNWGTSLLVSLSFLDMLSTLGASGTFLLYTVICILSLIFVYKYVPETKSRTLEQISAEFNSRKPRRILPKKLDCCEKKPRHRLRELRGRPSPAGSTTDVLLATSYDIQV